MCRYGRLGLPEFRTVSSNLCFAALPAAAVDLAALAWLWSDWLLPPDSHGWDSWALRSPHFCVLLAQGETGFCLQGLGVKAQSSWVIAACWKTKAGKLLKWVKLRLI